MPEHAYLAAVRESYDTVAADYAAQVSTPAGLDPLSRAMLAAFAETVRTAGRGPLADLGCGPGYVTAHLAGLGVPAYGVDLSPRMVEVARRAHPHLRFTVGSMTALDIGDGELGAVLAYYSTHHTPPELLPVVFAEFRRVLAPGGHLMLAGWVGEDEHLRPERAYGGHPVSYGLHMLPAPRLAALLEEAGLTVTARLVQEPAAGAKRRVVTLLAERPERP
ncbi:class I SAM-dependent methyltransferase [Actinacidiphila sp. bgisy160]|uniref:class I SAM-dependent methyltransferase n=1 Tax=Actinacidiphila sp. bgisy160 TaxID=3413796 RepID=UPI003D725B29